LLALTYQHLINEFWSATVAVNKTKEKGKVKKTSIKVVNKQDEFESQYQQIVSQSQQDNGQEGASAAHLIEQNTNIVKTQNIAPKGETSVDPNSLTSIVVNADVSLAVSDLQYQEMNPALLTNQPLPKYQQALQQQINVQQQELMEDDQGKVTFPKHVFSQARYVSKKQVQPISDLQRVQCEICHKSLKTKKMLWAHKVAVHYGGNFPCDICGKKCITGAELRRHLTSHSSERKFVCQYCGLAYKRWSHLYQHLRVHEEEKNFRCDVCHNNFKVQSELKDHCFAEHASGVMVQCSVCKHKLQTPLAVYYHSMKHTGTRDFICEICCANFKRKQHLVTHMKTHLTEKKPSAEGSPEVYDCQVCTDKSFNLKMELKAHCESDHPCDGSHELLVCRGCNKKLNVSHSVYLHGLRHSGVREFQCEDCSQLFKRKAHLLRHQIDRHPVEPKERKKREVLTDTITCRLCTRSFIYRAALIKHMSMQHGIFPKANGEIDIVKGRKKRHQCDVCLKRFKSKGNLTKHKINKHSTTTVEGSINLITGDVEMKSEQGNQMPELGSELKDEISATMIGLLPDEEESSAENPTDLEVNKENQLSTENLETISVIATESVTEDMSTAGNENNTLSVVYTTPSTETASVPTVPRQVITVDQQTGQIILMQTEHIPESSLTQASSGEKPQLVSLVVSSTTTTNADVGQLVNTQAGLAAFQQQSITDLSTITSNQLTQEVSMSQLINQDGVALSSLPIQTVQGLSEGQNVIDFSQGGTEQIVVLLSALNAQNMDQM